MKKFLIISAVALVVIICGISVFLVTVNNSVPGNALIDAARAADIQGLGDAIDCETTGYEVLSCIKARDYEKLAEYVHPEKGVLLSPYATVSPDANQTFTKDEVAALGTDRTKYYFGVYDGSGAVINMTAGEYFDTFVYDKDYENASTIGSDAFVHQGNALENVQEVFPESTFLDFCVDGKNDADWYILRLVFEQYGGAYKLVAIVHSQWTT